MKLYDAKYPKCGTVNKDLYLEETDGCMICEHCGADVKVLDFDNTQTVRIPLLTWEQVTRMMDKQEVAV